MKILILCTGNSCRSQMAHGFLQSLLPNAQIYSAGTAPHGVHPKSIIIMKEVGIDISHHTSNHVDEYKDIEHDYIITVCDRAHESCPVFIGSGKRIHYNFPDPDAANGTEEEIMDSFRSTRNLIHAFCKGFVSK